MPRKQALIVWGGWDGHEPDKVAARFQRILENEGLEVCVSDTLDACAATYPRPSPPEPVWPAITAVCATRSAKTLNGSL